MESDGLLHMCCNLLSEGQVCICVIQPSLFMVASKILLGFFSCLCSIHLHYPNFNHLEILCFIFVIVCSTHIYSYFIFINCTNIQFYKPHKLSFLKLSTFTCIQNISKSGFQLRRACPSVRPNGTTQPKLDGFS